MDPEKKRALRRERVLGFWAEALYTGNKNPIPSKIAKRYKTEFRYCPHVSTISTGTVASDLEEIAKSGQLRIYFNGRPATTLSRNLDEEERLKEIWKDTTFTVIEQHGERNTFDSFCEAVAPKIIQDILEHVNANAHEKNCRIGIGSGKTISKLISAMIAKLEQSPDQKKYFSKLEPHIFPLSGGLFRPGYTGQECHDAEKNGHDLKEVFAPAAECKDHAGLALTAQNKKPSWLQEIDVVLDEKSMHEYKPKKLQGALKPLLPSLNIFGVGAFSSPQHQLSLFGKDAFSGIKASEFTDLSSIKLILKRIIEASEAMARLADKERIEFYTLCGDVANRCYTCWLPKNLSTIPEAQMIHWDTFMLINNELNRAVSNIRKTALRFCDQNIIVACSEEKSGPLVEILNRNTIRFSRVYIDYHLGKKLQRASES